MAFVRFYFATVIINLLLAEAPNLTDSLNSVLTAKGTFVLTLKTGIQVLPEVLYNVSETKYRIKQLLPSSTAIPKTVSPTYKHLPSETTLLKRSGLLDRQEEGARKFKNLQEGLQSLRPFVTSKAGISNKLARNVSTALPLSQLEVLVDDEETEPPAMDSNNVKEIWTGLLCNHPEKYHLLHKHFPEYLKHVSYLNSWPYAEGAFQFNTITLVDLWQNHINADNSIPLDIIEIPEIVLPQSEKQHFNQRKLHLDLYDFSSINGHAEKKKDSLFFKDQMPMKNNNNVADRFPQEIVIHTPNEFSANTLISAITDAVLPIFESIMGSGSYEDVNNFGKNDDFAQDEVIEKMSDNSGISLQMTPIDGKEKSSFLIPSSIFNERGEAEIKRNTGQKLRIRITPKSFDGRGRGYGNMASHNRQEQDNLNLDKIKNELQKVLKDLNNRVNNIKWKINSFGTQVKGEVESSYDKTMSFLKYMFGEILPPDYLDKVLTLLAIVAFMSFLAVRFSSFSSLFSNFGIHISTKTEDIINQFMSPSVKKSEIEQALKVYEAIEKWSKEMKELDLPEVMRELKKSAKIERLDRAPLFSRKNVYYFHNNSVITDLLNTAPSGKKLENIENSVQVAASLIDFIIRMKKTKVDSESTCLQKPVCGIIARGLKEKNPIYILMPIIGSSLLWLLNPPTAVMEIIEYFRPLWMADEPENCKRMASCQLQ